MPRPPLRRRKPSPHANISSIKAQSASVLKDLQHKLAKKPVGKKPIDSDDSDQLVTKDKDGFGRRRTSSENVYASGGVAKGDATGSYPTRAQRRRSLRQTTNDLLAKENKHLMNNVISESTSKKDSEKSESSKPSKMQEKISRPLHNITNIPSSTIRPLPVARVEPTPAKENSILGTLKPRKRQPSILGRIDLDESTLNLEDEEQFLPDDESTPLPRPHNTLKSTVQTTPIISSTSRKRKLGMINPFDQTDNEIAPSVLARTAEASEPVLPPLPASTLRDSGRKRRQRDTNADDVMALPRSSSSEASPVVVKPISTGISKSKQRPAPTTEQLQALMPTRRRKTTRDRNQKHPIDIPEDLEAVDTASHILSDEDDSVFQPRKQQRKKATKIKSLGERKAKTSSRAAKEVKAKPGFSSSTKTTSIMSRSTRNRQAKSPLQPRQFPTANTPPRAVSIAKRYGGSHRDSIGKENLDSNPQNPNLLSLDKDSVIEIEKPKFTNKWAQIDAWDMDFEDVEVITSSSSPMRR